MISTFDFTLFQWSSIVSQERQTLEGHEKLLVAMKIQFVHMPHEFSIRGDSMNMHIAAVVGEDSLVFPGEETHQDRFSVLNFDWQLISVDILRWRDLGARGKVDHM